MNYQQHKHFNLSLFLEQTQELENCILQNEMEMNIMRSQLERLKSSSDAISFMNEVISEFQQVVSASFPALKENWVAKQMLENLSKYHYNTCFDLKAAFASVLMRLFFTQGKHRLFSKNNPRFFNKGRYHVLARRGYFIPEAWMEQLMTCLSEKKAEQDMLLHNLTPEWMWIKTGPLLLNLYRRTEEAINNENKQHGKTTHT